MEPDERRDAAGREKIHQGATVRNLEYSDIALTCGFGTLSALRAAPLYKDVDPDADGATGRRKGDPWFPNSTSHSCTEYAN
jgi:hypothetical protein